MLFHHWLEFYLGKLLTVQGTSLSNFGAIFSVVSYFTLLRPNEKLGVVFLFTHTILCFTQYNTNYTFGMF